MKLSPLIAGRFLICPELGKMNCRCTCCNQNPLCTGFLQAVVGMAFIPFRGALEPPVFHKNSASILILIIFYFEGGAGTGGRERVSVISTEAGLVLRGMRDTQVFSQQALCRALLEPNLIPVCQTTLSRGVRYREPVSNAKSSNGGEKKNKGWEEGRRGTWGKGKGENFPPWRKRQLFQHGCFFLK